MLKNSLFQPSLSFSFSAAPFFFFSVSAFFFLSASAPLFFSSFVSAFSTTLLEKFSLLLLFLFSSRVPFFSVQNVFASAQNIYFQPKTFCSFKFSLLFFFFPTFLKASPKLVAAQKSLFSPNVLLF